MRICLVIPLFGSGGGQRFISTISNFWSEAGHEVSIISLRKGDPFFSLSGNVSVRYLDYVEIKEKSKLNRLRSRLMTFFNLRNEIRKVNPDFVLSILSSTNVLTLLSTRMLDIPVYVNDVMSPYRKRSLLERKARKILYKRANGIIALTEEAKIFIMNETGCKNVIVIPRPVKKIKDYPDIIKEKIILSVGRLHPDKGHKYLLQICKKLNRKDWKFVILGEGELQQSLIELANNLDIRDQILFVGAVQNIDPWLRKASVFAFTSISEAWGNALTESMAAGVPSVSFDCDVAPRHIIEDGINGYIVPLLDIDAFVKKIEMLIDDPSLRDRISKKAKTDSTKYDLRNVGNSILDFCTIRK
ncbi:glycosyltransferase [Lutimonas saemankumensis]|uniref:glycosyltransferase n=1 Tax=Lutimonas saemankumensis TaxID=483016 RepID=UPI001CD49DA4|nr:glycosyltransferase [Lutimonas saemankumensis]MCA0931050.1 glycosyltransferase [Lutimonas saemankumensis]